jgi:hypothetical protein
MISLRLHRGLIYFACKNKSPVFVRYSVKMKVLAGRHLSLRKIRLIDISPRPGATMGNKTEVEHFLQIFSHAETTP